MDGWRRSSASSQLHVGTLGSHLRSQVCFFKIAIYDIVLKFAMFIVSIYVIICYSMT